MFLDTHVSNQTLSVRSLDLPMALILKSCTPTLSFFHSLSQLPTNVTHFWHDPPGLQSQLTSTHASTLSRTSSTVAQMYKLLKATFGFRSDFDEQSSTSSSASSSNGIEVRVGRRPHARFVHISRSALKACPVLRARLVQGCNVTNADAVVFEFVLEYMNSSGMLGQLRPNARNPLTQLTGSCDMMLKLAKA
mgnify:CR=1 FL=1